LQSRPRDVSCSRVATRCPSVRTGPGSRPGLPARPRLLSARPDRRLRERLVLGPIHRGAENRDCHPRDDIDDERTGRHRGATPADHAAAPARKPPGRRHGGGL